MPSIQSRIVLATVAALVLSCASSRPSRPASGVATKVASPPPPRELSYEIRPIATGATRLQIDLLFQGDADGKSDVVLPSGWAGEDRFYDGIDNFVALGEARVEPVISPTRHTIRHRPGAQVHVRYVVRQDWSGTPVKEYRPHLQEQYFHFFGGAFFAHPDWDEEIPVSVALRWTVPAEWTIANSFGTGERSQRFLQTIGRFLHAVYVGGDFRTQKLAVHGQPVFIAVRGEWKWKDGEFSDLVQRVMLMEREFWDDHDFPYFLITLIPVGNECCSYGGTGLTNSFATFISTDKGIDGRLVHLLAHELFHTWNGRRIGRQDPEELVYWFSEGFTDYYTRLLTLRAGLITLQEYVAGYNDVLRTYYASPARNVPNARVREAFWKDRAVEKLPYQRGDILAHNWNSKIQEASKGKNSLDDVMRDLLAAARRNGTVVSAANLDALVRKYLPQGILEDSKNDIDAGKTILPAEGALGPCVSLRQRSLAQFELGFDFAASKTNRLIQGVKADSAAYKAGLRDGQKLRGWSVRFGHATETVRLTLDEPAGKRVVEYLPVGESVETPQYVLDERRLAAEPGVCLSWFGLVASPASPAAVNAGASPR